MDYSDQTYGALVPVAVLDTWGQVLDDDVELWEDLDNGADLPCLVGNLNDDDVWSDYRTHYNEQDRSSGINPCLDLKSAVSITQGRISLVTAGVRNVYAPGAEPEASAPAPELPAGDAVHSTEATEAHRAYPGRSGAERPTGHRGRHCVRRLGPPGAAVGEDRV